MGLVSRVINLSAYDIFPQFRWVTSKPQDLPRVTTPLCGSYQPIQPLFKGQYGPLLSTCTYTNQQRFLNTNKFKFSICMILIISYLIVDAALEINVTWSGIVCPWIKDYHYYASFHPHLFAQALPVTTRDSERLRAGGKETWKHVTRYIVGEQSLQQRHNKINCFTSLYI
jgi:hypothetical protein